MLASLWEVSGHGEEWDRRALRQTSLQWRNRVNRQKIFGFTFLPVVLWSRKQLFLWFELFLCVNNIRLCRLGM